jgi:uncharacterized membrane protein YhfC
MVSSAVLVGIAVSAVLSVVWPLAIFMICRRRMTLLGRNVLVGAGVFVLFSQVLEKGLHAYLLKANPATAAWFHAHSIAFAFYGCVAAGLFEEVGRYLGMRFFVSASGNPGAAVAYGIGHGGVEAFLIGGVAMAETFVFATLLNSGRFEATLGPTLPPDALAQLRAGLEQLTVAGLTMGTLERLVAMLIQIGLSLVVWRAVEKKQLGFLALAILLHALIDLPAGLFQAGLMSSLAAEGPILVTGVALAALFLYKLPRKVPVSPQLTR